MVQVGQRTQQDSSLDLGGQVDGPVDCRRALRDAECCYKVQFENV